MRIEVFYFVVLVLLGLGIVFFLFLLGIFININFCLFFWVFFCFYKKKYIIFVCIINRMLYIVCYCLGWVGVYVSVEIL